VSAGRVQLFATCLGDLFFPEAVADADVLLREAGFAVELPSKQVCCGQPAFNSGHRKAARRVARTFVKAFSRSLPVVLPSGSCTTMVSHYLPELVGSDRYDVWELSAFLDTNGIELPLRNEGRVVAYHDSCHMTRELGISRPPRRLLERTGAQVVLLPRADLCCGFGGTFSVRQPEVSVAMADDKLTSAFAVHAEALVTADPGCLMHLRGRAARTGGLPVVHLATALAKGLGPVGTGPGPARPAEDSAPQEEADE
jgi:L-lactate dehydrogenase complex protein LldE